jgi:GDP-4-dehydro-6-deoxy-D-mannose reductase
MKVLITGIAGFAGSHLVELLLSKKYSVFGTVEHGDACKNVCQLKGKLNLIECDLTDFNSVKKVLQKTKPEEIYHLAGYSSVGKSFFNPLLVFQTNFYGSLNLLECIRQQKLDSKILLVSSVEIYGKVKPNQIPIKEDIPLAPISPYGTSKAGVDLLAYQYFRSYGLKTIRVRSFNHIGPRQNRGFVVPDFASQIAGIEKGWQKPIIQVGKLSFIRDFTDVRDVVKAYYLLMKKGKIGEAYNLCSGKGYKIKFILEHLLSLTSQKIKIKIGENQTRPTDIPILIGNNKKVKSKTGWSPKIPMEKSLEDTLNYWRKINH